MKLQPAYTVWDPARERQGQIDPSASDDLLQNQQLLLLGVRTLHHPRTMITHNKVNLLKLPLKPMRRIDPIDPI